MSSRENSRVKGKPKWALKLKPVKIKTIILSERLESSEPQKSQPMLQRGFSTTRAIISSQNEVASPKNLFLGSSLVKNAKKALQFLGSNSKSRKEKKKRSQELSSTRDQDSLFFGVSVLIDPLLASAVTKLTWGTTSLCGKKVKQSLS